MADLVAILVALVILALLARAGRHAWRNRRLAVAVWRRIRVRHVVGCAGLLVAVLTTAIALLVAVPVTGYGLGYLIGLTGNAVFAPLEATVWRESPPGGAGGGIGWVGAVATVGFLGLLLAMLPWLAHVEERVFRVGLEGATLGQELWTALRFGLLHLVMLIPLAAALAIAVAGLAYGRIYRAAYHRAASRSRTVPGVLGMPVEVATTPAQARSEAAMVATVWHTTFNSLVVVLVGLAVLAGA